MIKKTREGIHVSLEKLGHLPVAERFSARWRPLEHAAETRIPTPGCERHLFCALADCCNLLLESPRQGPSVLRMLNMMK
jgi:hypothetical protein